MKKKQNCRIEKPEIMILKFQKILRLFVLLMAGIILMNGCVDKDFDAPDPLDIPLGEVHTIAELRQMFAAGGNQPIKFTEDVTVFGVITMDASSGNIYRSAFLQDETAAINLRLMSPGGLYQGDSLRLNLKGTTLGSYENMLQIDSVHVGNSIEKLSTMVDVEPALVNINTLLSDAGYQARLIKLENVEFHNNELGQTFADPDNLIAQNRILKDCDGNQIIVRTSGYANFAGAPIPDGNGSIIAVLAQFRDDRQLFIRNIDEVVMNDDRCPVPGEDMDPITIAEIKELFNQGTTSVPPNRRLEGVVISDREHDNHPGQNLYLMDENGDGLAIRFAAFHDYDLGDQIRILAGSLPISRFNGLLQISDIPLGNGVLLGDGVLPEPTLTTIDNLKSNFDNFESTLIRIENVVIPPAGTFNGNITVSDDTGEAIMYTYPYASFANTPVTPGIYNITVIASYYNQVQLLLRNLNDLEFVDEYDPGETDLLTIAEIRDIYNDGANSVPAGYSIEGVIISDKDNGNTTGRNAVIQDETAGIMLRFTSNHDLNLGDKVKVHVGTAELSEFNGLLQINNIPNGNASLLQTGVSVEPVETTIQNLLGNMDTFESTLVRIVNATITGGSNFQGERTVNDGTGNIIMFTRNDATFAGESLPTDAVTLTAVVTVFNTPQIFIRNLNDIE
ncbi:MAG: hypothetical protein K0B37_07765 [Bacteroidales bacterium]|nr:hypothetical protein [Bacteroidales bacterium]